MSDASFIETGPGSYEIQDSLGYLSHKYYNSPRAIIAKAKKTNKQFLSVELNKQLSGLESPGVNTYNPNVDKFLSKSPSALFGKEKRTMSHITPLLGRSPGPVYFQANQAQPVGISFTRARRNSSVEPVSPAPWDYKPSVPTSKISAVIFKATFEKSAGMFSTPGPGSYNLKESSPVRGAYVSRVGRSIVGGRETSPGPGSYECKSVKNGAKVAFGTEKRDIDPRKCKD